MIFKKDLDETVDSNANSDSDSMDPNDSDEQVKPKRNLKN